MDASEIGELYERFGPVIYRRCLKLLADPVLSRDACQEVFVRAMRHAEKLISDRECLPWLYRVTTNFCLNLIRDNDKVTLLPLCHEVHETLENRVEQKAAASEEVRYLLNRFNEIDAQIAVFAYLDRMTQEEIAEVTGLSRKTVGKKLKYITEEAKENRLFLQEAKL